MVKKNKSYDSLRRHVASLVIEYIIKHLQGKNVQELIDFGISIETQNSLENMSAVDLEGVKDNYSLYITNNRFDPELFEKSIIIAVNNKINNELIKQAFLLGAPYPLMYHLFGLHSGDCANWKKIMGLSSSSGRTKIPSLDDQIAIHEEWSANKDLDEIKRFIKTSEKTGIALSKIWSLYNKERKNISFIEPERPVRRSKYGAEI